MDVEEIQIPRNRCFVDGSALTKLSIGVDLRGNELDFSGDDPVPKARKPYTITKQREKWTQDEHNKFLEALQIHGRAWRRIQEHIGTKTTVQIRSHAQKFFSKVVRESSANDGPNAPVAAIHIPPPRPKRRPTRPYPRKVRSAVLVEKPSLRRGTTVCDRHNGSPTSVLSTVVSETLGLASSNALSSCPSPVSSASGSNEQSLDKFVGDGAAAGFATETELCRRHFEEASSQEGRPTVLKLFGKTVAVAELHRFSKDTERMDLVKTTDQLLRIAGDESSEHSELFWRPIHGSSLKLPGMELKTEGSRTDCADNVAMPPFRSCFLPYERCCSESGTPSTGEERDTEFTRLCL